MAHDGALEQLQHAIQELVQATEEGHRTDLKRGTVREALQMLEWQLVHLTAIIKDMRATIDKLP